MARSHSRVVDANVGDGYMFEGEDEEDELSRRPRRRRGSD